MKEEEEGRIEEPKTEPGTELGTKDRRCRERTSKPEQSNKMPLSWGQNLN
jgi:hypothetical protein